MWVNEAPAKAALVQAAVLLAATDHLVLGTGITNICARPPQTVTPPQPSWRPSVGGGSGPPDPSHLTAPDVAYSCNRRRQRAKTLAGAAAL